MEWKTSDGINIINSKRESELEPLIKGLLNKRTLLDVIRPACHRRTPSSRSLQNSTNRPSGEKARLASLVS